jgi:hypothetical protein
MKTYSMTKAEQSELLHYQMMYEDYTKMSMVWKNEAGFVIQSVLKRCGEDPDKLVEDKRKLNVDFEKGIIEVTEPITVEVDEKEETSSIVMPNGDPAQPVTSIT